MRFKGSMKSGSSAFLPAAAICNESFWSLPQFFRSYLPCSKDSPEFLFRGFVYSYGMPDPGHGQRVYKMTDF